MNSKKCALLATALALPFSIATALAAESPMASDHKIACSEVKYSSEFLSKYPDAPAACLEAIEKDGKRYAKFTARVFLNSADRTTVELLNPHGDPLTTFSFKSTKPACGARRVIPVEPTSCATRWWC